MQELINYFQLGANSIALLVAGWIYVAYIKNLKSQLDSKDDQIKAVEKNLALWKDRASVFEKKTPEYMEEVLSKRIKHREEEIKRLELDKDENIKLASVKTRELSRLRSELERTIYLGQALTYYDSETEQELPIPEAEVEVEELGEIFVDSASILISDPMYVQNEWDREDEYVNLPLYKNIETGKVYQYGVDFTHYQDDKIAELDDTPNALIEKGKIIPIEIQRELSYSYPGAAYASSKPKGYGILKFKSGNEGAGICVSTVYGDGGYTVYGERFRGDLVRIFIDLR